MTNPITVTITGADDAVDPTALAILSHRYPFVEWAVLLSKKRAGSPRYPSLEWVQRFLGEADRRGVPMQRAAHLCGTLAQEMVARAPWRRWHMTLPRFDRVQVNGYDCGPQAHDVPHVVALSDVADEHDYTFILQCRHEDELQDCANEAAEIGHRAQVLFDPSGGRGLEPFSWPQPPLGCRVGFAGGIGPDNVTEVYGEAAMRGASWIDMESGVRDEHDRFDLARVRSVLEQVAAIRGAG